MCPCQQQQPQLGEDTTAAPATSLPPQPMPSPGFFARHNIDFKAPLSTEEKVGLGVGIGAAALAGLLGIRAMRKRRKGRR